LLSHEKVSGQVRQYPTAKQKRVIRERDMGTCQICGSTEDNLQYDHKVPLDRNGPTTVENLQMLCSACNVEKRGACKRCEQETCDGCVYAYPELYGSRLVVCLEAAVAEQLRENSQARGVPDTVLAADIIARYFATDSN
jgi:hypothetical protein